MVEIRDINNQDGNYGEIYIIMLLDKINQLDMNYITSNDLYIKNTKNII